MGEVFRATDTRLHLEVAITISTEQFTERFEREARGSTSLNYPNICTLHDVGPNYLVVGLVEGPALADGIKQGALPIEEALSMDSGDSRARIAHSVKVRVSGNS